MTAVQTQGTRFFVTDDIVTIVPSTSDETPEGMELNGVTSATVYYKADDIVRAELELYIAHEAISGTLHWYANHPETGEWKEINRIEFADGSAFEC